MENTKEKSILIGVLSAIASEFIYGLSYVFTKYATGQASGLALLGWRFFLALVGFIFFAFLGVVKIRRSSKPIIVLLIIGILNPVIYFICETIGIINTTASESGAFLACIPAMSVLASTLILKKKPKRKLVIGISVSLIGVLITIAVAGVDRSFSRLGYLMLAIAVSVYGIHTVFIEKAEDYTEEEITFFMLLLGAITFISLALIEALIQGNIGELVSLPIQNKGFLLAAFYQGIGCSIFAVLLSNVAIARIGVNWTSSFIGISTVVSILAGVIFLGESFSMGQVIGVIIISLGVYIANIRMGKEIG